MLFLIFMGLLLGCVVGICVATAIWNGTVEAYQKDCKKFEEIARRLARDNAVFRKAINESIDRFYQAEPEPSDPADWWKA